MNKKNIKLHLLFVIWLVITDILCIIYWKLPIVLYNYRFGKWQAIKERIRVKAYTVKTILYPLANHKIFPVLNHKKMIYKLLQGVTERLDVQNNYAT